MDDTEYDHMVCHSVAFRLPKTVWQRYPAPCVDQQAKRVLAEELGLHVELDTQTTVLRVQEDVVVRME